MDDKRKRRIKIRVKAGIGILADFIALYMFKNFKISYFLVFWTERIFTLQVLLNGSQRYSISN